MELDTAGVSLKMVLFAAVGAAAFGCGGGLRQQPEKDGGLTSGGGGTGVIHVETGTGGSGGGATTAGRGGSASGGSAGSGPGGAIAPPHGGQGGSGGTAGTGGIPGSGAGGAAGSGSAGRAGTAGTAGTAGAAGTAGTAGAAGANGGTCGSKGGAGGSSTTGPDGGPSFSCTPPATDSVPALTSFSRAGAPPAMTGGAITNGTYYETQEDDYNGESSDMLNHHIVVIDQVHGGFGMNSSDPTKQMEAPLAGVLTVGCTTLTVDPSPCQRSHPVATFQYTATATTLTLIDASHPNRVMRFTKQ